MVQIGRWADVDAGSKTGAGTGVEAGAETGAEMGVVTGAETGACFCVDVVVRHPIVLDRDLLGGRCHVKREAVLRAHTHGYLRLVREPKRKQSPSGWIRLSEHADGATVGATANTLRWDQRMAPPKGFLKERL